MIEELTPLEYYTRRAHEVEQERDALEANLNDVLVARVADQAEYQAEIDALQAKLEFEHQQLVISNGHYVDAQRKVYELQAKLQIAVEALEKVAMLPICELLHRDIAQEALKQLEGE